LEFQHQTVLILTQHFVIIHLAGPFMVNLLFYWRIGTSKTSLKCFRISVWKKIQERRSTGSVSEYGQRSYRFFAQWIKHGSGFPGERTNKRTNLSSSFFATLCSLYNQRLTSDSRHFPRLVNCFKWYIY
jgi:hypothetical protein